MFQKGDFLMFRNSGVCRVIDIETPSFVEDKERKYYRLEPVFPKKGLTVIYSPVDRNTSIRPLISKEEAKQYLDDFGSLKVEIFHSAKPNLLNAHYNELLSSFTFENYLRLLKEIHLKEEEAVRKDRHLSQVDLRYKEEAEQLVFEELAFIFGISCEEARKRFCSRAAAAMA